MDEAEYSRKVATGRKVAGAIGSLVNARSLQGFCPSHCWCLFLGMIVRMIWREKERSRIRAVQMDNLRGLLGIRRMDKVLNARIRQLCGVTKVVAEKIDNGVL